MKTIRILFAAVILCGGGLFVSQAAQANAIESALLLKEGRLRGITVTSVPDRESGSLICEGVRVERFDYLDRNELSSLVFEGVEKDSTASFSLIPDTGDDAKECIIVISCEENTSPQSVILTNARFLWSQAQKHYYSAF